MYSTKLDCFIVKLLRPTPDTPTHPYYYTKGKICDSSEDNYT